MKKILSTMIMGLFVVSGALAGGLGNNKPLTDGLDLSLTPKTEKSGIFSAQKTTQGGAAFEEGKVTITVGYGFPNLGKSIFKIYETELNYKATGFGPMHFRAEYGLSDKISFGLSVNYVSFGFEYDSDDWLGTGTTYNYALDYSSFSFLGRMNIHFATTEKIDPYWGVGAGYRTGSWKWTSDDPDFVETEFSGIPFGFETTLGMRYYFTPNIGAYVEFGLAKSLMQGGLAVAF